MKEHSVRPGRRCSPNESITFSFHPQYMPSLLIILLSPSSPLLFLCSLFTLPLLTLYSPSAHYLLSFSSDIPLLSPNTFSSSSKPLPIYSLRPLSLSHFLFSSSPCPILPISSSSSSNHITLSPSPPSLNSLPPSLTSPHQEHTLSPSPSPSSSSIPLALKT